MWRHTLQCSFLPATCPNLTHNPCCAAAPLSYDIQAANLLRALRQNKEAAGLGLLEGVKGERGATDIEASRGVYAWLRFPVDDTRYAGWT